MANTFTTNITPEQGEKLLSYIQAKEFTITNPPYAHFSAKTKGLSITYYESGKLVVQGKEKDEFIRFTLEPEILNTLEYSHPITTVDTHEHIGVDEAGKGDLFGPLCIAALHADTKGIETLLEMGVKDSKQMSDPTILKLSKQIKQSFSFEIFSLYPAKYNELYGKFKNLNHLLAWCHSRVIDTVATATKCSDVLIDQFASEHLVANAVKKLHVPVNLRQRHKGESDPVVAGASILARAAFVEGISKLSEHYKMDLPKGASSLVVKAGKNFVKLYGEEELKSVAKLHFKTINEILQKLDES